MKGKSGSKSAKSASTISGGSKSFSKTNAVECISFADFPQGGDGDDEFKFYDFGAYAGTVTLPINVKLIPKDISRT